MIFKKNVWFLILFIILLFYFFIPPAFAQESQGISISPLNFDLSANPGDVLKNVLRLYNPSDQTTNVKISIEDFKPIGEDGQVEIIEPDLEIERTYSLARWVTVEPKEFNLEPREQKIVDFTITVPMEAEPGAKYGSIVANMGGAEVGGGSSVLQKVASLILLSVIGEVKENLIVHEFKGPEFQEYGPVNFTLRLENQGSVHLRPRGFVTITDWQNKKTADLPIPQMAIIPGAKRIIDIKWDKKNILGYFTATVVGNYGSTNEPMTATWTFWIWPWKISLIILIIVILLMILLIRGRKRFGAAFKILFKGEKIKAEVSKEEQPLNSRNSSQEQQN